MAANTTPRYPAEITGTTVVTTGTANTSRVNPPTASSIVDGPVAGANGAVCQIAAAVCTVTSTAGLFQVWHKIGSTYFLLGEVVTAAATPSTTVAAATAAWIPPDGPIKLAAGERLAFSTSRAEVWAVRVEQQDY